MARQRDYRAEYQARQQRAQERGFASYSEERQFRKETVEERTTAAEALHVDVRTADPTAMVSYYENVLVPIAEGQEVTGKSRHDAVTAYMDLGYSEEEAIEMMRELYGSSPGGD